LSTFIAKGMFIFYEVGMGGWDLRGQEKGLAVKEGGQSKEYGL